MNPEPRDYGQALSIKVNELRIDVAVAIQFKDVLRGAGYEHGGFSGQQRPGNGGRSGETTRVRA